MTGPLTFKSATLRTVAVPLRRPVVSKVGLFKEWPLILIDVHTEQGVRAAAYLEPYRKDAARAIVAVIERYGYGPGRQTACTARPLSGDTSRFPTAWL